MYLDSKGNINLKDRYNILGVVDCTADKFYGDGSNLTNLPWSADPMTTRGDIIYRNSSNVTARFGLGTVGQVISSDGTDLIWSSAGAGDVTGPSSATDENITVFDSTTGKVIKDSGVNISAVTANSAKVTNATHTGDVTGDTALTIGLNKVNDTHIDWGTGSNQISQDNVVDGSTYVRTHNDFTDTYKGYVDTNNSKVSNVTTNLSEGTATETTVDVNSSDGTNATLVSASTSRAGLLTKAKFDEIVANTSKATNATHTGEVTGATTLTVDKTAITGKAEVTVADTDYLLISDTSDSGNLKKILASDFAGGTGTVTSVAVSGSDGIEVDSGSPITTSGTIALGVNKTTMLSTLNVEDGADVTDTTNVTAAGAVMDSEVDANIKTLALPASTTISTYGASLIDDTDAATARSTLDVDQAGTDNSTDVTLNASATTGGMSISTQEISNQAATNAQNGYMTSALVSNIETNNAKVSNVTTNITVVEAPTNVEIQSSDGTNDTIAAADETNAGVMTTAMYDEHVLNNAKVSFDWDYDYTDLINKPTIVSSVAGGTGLTSTGGTTPSLSHDSHTGEVTGATALTIANNVVDEANMKISNAPTNDYVLVADSGATGGWKWALVSSVYDVVDDTTPQLGGALDLNSKPIKVVGQTVAGSNGDVVYLSGANTWTQADASAESSCSKQLGIRISSTEVCVYGLYTTTGLTAGSLYYVSETTGAITTTAPTTSTSIKRSIGEALSTTLLFVKPNTTYVENA